MYFTMPPKSLLSMTAKSHSMSGKAFLMTSSCFSSKSMQT